MGWLRCGRRSPCWQCSWTGTTSHGLLARIAVARRDADAAREQAALARKADPALPMPAFVDGRLLFDQAKYDEALPFFEEAIAEIGKKHASAFPELHLYAAET